MPVFGAPGKPGELLITTAATKESRRWRNGIVTWEELLEWVEEPSSRKECGGYVLGHLIEDPGPRVRENLKARSAISLDADKAKPDFLDRLKLALDGVAWLAHSTFSSTPEEPRYRVIVPLDSPVDADTYTALVRVLLRRIDPDEVEFDVAASTRPEQFMWKPAVPKGAKLSHYWCAGPALYPDDYAVPLVAELRAMLAEERAASAALVIEVDRDPTADEIEAAEALLAHETARVRDAIPGERNETISSALYRLFRFVKTGCLDEDAVVASLEEAAPFGSGYTMAEFKASLEGARRKAPAEWPKLTVGTAADDFSVVDDALAAELGLDPEDAAAPAGTPREKDIRRALYDLLVRDAAQHAFRLTKEPPRAPLEFMTQEDARALPPAPPFRVEGLMPPDGFTTLIAQNKSGKTTAMLNLAACLISGQPFLGEFKVVPVDGTVAFLNYEMSRDTFHAWAEDLDISRNRFLAMHLRGIANPLARPEAMEELAGLLRKRDVETLLVDPFGKAYTGDSQDDAGEVRKWLTMLDDLARGAGVRDVVLAVHTGWDGSRSRGSSALEDHPDSKLYMEKDEKGRWFRAEGRDVDLPKGELRMDQLTRRLAYVPPESQAASLDAEKAARVAEFREEVLAAVRDEPGISMNQLRDMIPRRRNDVGTVVAELAKERLLEIRHEGRRRALYLLEDDIDGATADFEEDHYDDDIW